MRSNFSERKKPQFADKRDRFADLLRRSHALSEDILSDHDLIEKLKSTQIWRLKSMALSLHIYRNNLLRKHGIMLTEYLNHLAPIVHCDVDTGTNKETHLFCRYYASSAKKSMYESMVLGISSLKSMSHCRASDTGVLTTCNDGIDMNGVTTIEGKSRPGCIALKEKNAAFREDLFKRVREGSFQCGDVDLLFSCFDDFEIMALKRDLSDEHVRKIDETFKSIIDMQEEILQQTSDLLKGSM